MNIRGNTVRIIYATSFVFSFSVHASQAGANCSRWFEAGKVKPGGACELDCSILMTDMNTFMCPNQCRDLCEVKSKKNILEKVIFYPGLTPSEKKLVEKYPNDALTAFIQKTRAEWSSGRNFPEQGLNDEGDAFRHFVWAGLLTKELGPAKAKEFLNAHEENPLKPDSERDMDHFNNERGASSATNLILQNKWSIESLEKSGLEALKSKNLKVLNPVLKIPEVPR